MFIVGLLAGSIATTLVYVLVKKDRESRIVQLIVSDTGKAVSNITTFGLKEALDRFPARCPV